MKFLFTSILLVFIASDLFSQSANNIQKLIYTIETEQNDSIKIFLMYDLAKLYEQKDLDSSNFYYHKAIELSQKINNKSLIAESDSRIAAFYKSVKQFKKAIGYYKKSSNFFLIEDDTLGKANTYFEICKIYHEIQTYDSSIYFGINSEKLFKSIKNYEKTADNEEFLGSVCTEIHLYDDAAFYFTSALNYADSANNICKKSKIYNRLGYLYLKIEDYKNSLQYLNLALDLAVNNNYEQNLSEIYFNFGEVYLYKKQKNVATSYFLKAKEYYEKYKDKNGQFKVYVRLAQLNQETPYYAMSFLRQAGLLASKDIPYQYKSDFYQIAATLYFKQKKYEEAYLFLQKRIEINDSLLNKVIIHTSYKMEYKLQTKSKESTIKQLNEINQRSNQLLEREKEKQKAYRIILILFLVVLVLLILTLANFYKNIKLNKKLKYKNKKLEEAQQKLIHILDAFPEIFLEMDENANILYANNSFYNKIEKKQKNKYYFDDYLKPEYLEDFYLIYDNLKLASGTKKIEAEIKFADGTYKYGIISLTSKINDRKKVVYANIIDINEKKEIEKFFKLLKISVDQSPVGLVITDTDANIVYVNEHYTKVTGYGKEELVGSNIRIIRSGKNPIQLYSELWQTILKGENWHGKILNKRKNGTLYWERNNISSIVDSFGKITNFFSIKEDITEELEQNEKILKLFTAAEKNPVSVMILDSKAKISYVNKSFERITGYNAVEVVGRTPSFLDSEEENPQTYHNMKKAIYSGNIWQGVIINKRKNGQKYYSSSIIIPLKNNFDQLIGFVCNDQDITEEIVTNRKLKETSLELRRKNKEIISSFRYAHKIQENLMSNRNKLSQIFKNNFVLFLPKDIVSGDFYWTYDIDNIGYIALVDCTGHGVPGAFLSILGVTILESAFNDQHLRENNEIINYLSSKFRAFIYNADDKKDILKDNMEISLVSVDRKAKQISYSGARSKGYFLSSPKNLDSDNKSMISTVYADDDINIYCLKADRFYLSTYFQYQQVKFSYEQFDEIILTTDGYLDQFSSLTNKKLKRTNFESILVEISNIPIKEQKKVLLNTFINFKADEEQTDDVSVIGIKLINY